MSVSFDHVRLFGERGGGTFSIHTDKCDWKDRQKTMTKEIERTEMKGASYSLYGQYMQLIVKLTDGKVFRFDGFEPGHLSKLQSAFDSNLKLTMDKEAYWSAGGNYGNLVVEDKALIMQNSSGDAKLFDMPLGDVAQCVMPGTSKQEVEVQFHENDEDKEEDSLVQVTFKFPKTTEGEGEDEENEKPAELLHKMIIEAASIRNVTGNVIAEFTKEQGQFITPRGRYAIQMTPTFLRMQGQQYDYKIMYTDIKALFLLPKPDGMRFALVISLERAIRQGQQKYASTSLTLTLTLTPTPT